jgi:hypothetical protein
MHVGGGLRVRTLNGVMFKHRHQGPLKRSTVRSWKPGSRCSGPRIV